MLSVALREGGQLALNCNKPLKGYNNNILPFVAFLLAKTSGVPRSEQRMPVNLSSAALCAGGSSWRRRNVRMRIATTIQQGDNDNVLHLFLRSIEHPEQRYIGHTADLRERLIKHNKGDVPYTAKFRPWKIEMYIAFESEEKSIAFEAYLKSGSGHAFAKRHF